MIKCTKCGQEAFNVKNVRDEEGTLLQVIYQHDMTHGYVWNCTQTMEYQPKYTVTGSVKKEMDKHPQVFKSRAAKHHNNLYGRKVGN